MAQVLDVRGELARAIRRQIVAGPVPVEYSSALSSGDSLPITSASVDGKRSICGLRMRDSTAHSAATYAVCGATWRPAGGLAQPLAVQRLLVADVEDERHADQLDAALEALEVRDLAERGEVDVVAAADEHEVEEQRRARHRQRGALDGGQQILVVLERALEQIVELDHAAVRADDLAAVLVQRHRLQRRRQRRRACDPR